METKNEVERLIADYRAKSSSMTEPEKAAYEHNIWNATVHVPEIRAKYDNKRTYLRSKLNLPGARIELYSQLYVHGADADLIWDQMVNHSMGYTTARKLLIRAHELRTLDQRLAVATSIKKAFEEWQINYPNKVLNKNGTIHRRASNSAFPNLKTLKAVLPRGRPKVDDANFWNMLRNRIAEFVAVRLEGLPEYEKHKMYRDFEVDLRILVDDFQGKLSKAFSQQKHMNEKSISFLKKVKRPELLEACRILGMDPPKPGHQVDLAKAKRKKKMISREHHPDVNPTQSEAAKDYYRSVIDAYQTIERYHEETAKMSVSHTYNGEQA